MRRVPPGNSLQLLDSFFPRDPILLGLIALKESDILLEDILQLSPAGHVKGVHFTVVVHVDRVTPQTSGV